MNALYAVVINNIVYWQASGGGSAATLFKNIASATNITSNVSVYASGAPTSNGSKIEQISATGFISASDSQGFFVELTMFSTLPNWNSTTAMKTGKSVIFHGAGTLAVYGLKKVSSNTVAVLINEGAGQAFYIILVRFNEANGDLELVPGATPVSSQGNNNIVSWSMDYLTGNKVMVTAAAFRTNPSTIANSFAQVELPI